MTDQGKTEQTAVVAPDQRANVIFARSIDQMRESLAEMSRFVSEVMVDGEDYMVIPGCGDKPSLLKPGAEKLSQLYNYAPCFHLEDSNVSKEFVRYHYKCEMIDKDGRSRGEGEGTANSEEPKFMREEMVPLFKATEEQKAIGRIETRKSKAGKDYKAVLITASPLGMENTICKMAQKRAFVAAVLCSTRLSNKFTQDVEDMPKSAFGNAPTEEAEVYEYAPEAAAPQPETKTRRTKSTKQKAAEKKALKECESAQTDITEAFKGATSLEELLKMGDDFKGSIKDMPEEVQEKLRGEYQAAKRKLTEKGNKDT